MTNNRKIDQQNESQTTGTDAATPSTAPAAVQPDGNGQQGAGGIGGVTERTTPNPRGSQPQLGGADEASSGRKPGTGLTEDSDPTSENAVPEVSHPETSLGRNEGAGSDVENRKQP